MASRSRCAARGLRTLALGAAATVVASLPVPALQQLAPGRVQRDEYGGRQEFAPRCIDIVSFERTTEYEALPVGTVPDSVLGRFGYGPIGVYGDNPNLPGQNAAVIFDTSAPTGGDLDLGTPNQDFGGPGVGAGGASGGPFPNQYSTRHVIVVADDLEDLGGDGLVDDPDATDVPSTLRFDFSAIAPVRLRDIDVIDVDMDEAQPVLELRDINGVVVDTRLLPQTGDNGFANVPVGVGNVAYVEIRLFGSAAIDDLVFTCERDCNDNGVSDGVDIESGTSQDCNGDRIPDECQADCDADGIPDDCEPDCNQNGRPDDCDLLDGTSTDVDGNGVPDECDPDCDDDGVPDGAERDCDGNGTPDDCEPLVDCNGNQVPDACDIADGTSTDLDGNGVPDECDADCDQDGVPDAAEPDCDDDGTPDDCEDDCDGDGVPNDCDDTPGTPVEYCAGAALADDCAGGPSDHALVLFGVGDFVFASGGELVEHFDGSAELHGVLERIGAPQERFSVTMWLDERVDPGAPDHPPTGSPKLELDDDCYVAGGGAVDPSGWRYYRAMEGTLAGLGDYAGAVYRLTPRGPALQIGAGASGKNVLFGASMWFQAELLSPADGGASLPWTDEGDLNVSLEECPPDGDATDCADVAVPDPDLTSWGSIHALWSPELATDLRFVSGGQLVQRADGSARLTGVVQSPSAPLQCWRVDMLFGGRVDPGDSGYPPPGSPYLAMYPSSYVQNGGPIDPGTWRYYTELSGLLTGCDGMAGAVLRITRRGPSFQVGHGANLKNGEYGGSGWWDVETLAQPDSGPTLPSAFTGDTNVDLGECEPCEVEDPLVPRLLVHYGFDEQSGDVVGDAIGGMDLVAHEDASTSSFLEWVVDANGTGLRFDQDTDGTALVSTTDPLQTRPLREALQASGEFTVQVFFRSEDGGNFNARLATWSSSIALADRNLSMMCYSIPGTFSELRVKTDTSTYSEVEPLSLVPGTPCVLTMTHAADGTTTLYSDGLPTASYSNPGTFGNWTDRHFALGNELTRVRAFRGTLYDVKVWDLALEPGAVLAEAQDAASGN